MRYSSRSSGPTSRLSSSTKTKVPRTVKGRATHCQNQNSWTGCWKQRTNEGIQFSYHAFQKHSASSIYLAFGNIDEYWWDLLEFIIDNRGFSTLESLDIRLGPQPLADEELGTVKIPYVLWDSPALKRLATTMEKVDLPDGMDAYCNIVVAPRWALKTRIPYHQLTHLLLDVRDEADLTWTELHKIFSMARNVVCAFFSGIKPHLPDQRRGQPPAHPIRLEYLRHLYLQIPGDPFDAYIGCRLDTRLIAPSLKTLAIVGDFVDWDQHEYNTHDEIRM